MLRKSLKWREENGIASILTWAPPAAVLELLPFDATNCELGKNNYPVVIIPMGRWDYRKAVADGKLDECVRWKTVGSFAVLEFFKTAVGQFESNYPEVLSKCFVINGNF
ncbi:unnamed protein product [Allacma fusca]|uniref:Uncharacterized protein n=1 Tax=Allacma fusca TaxID=39272 RepID=A0A8J2JKJ5_9HEXA|nr:unnamed protein product [Allacma fusca]